MAAPATVARVTPEDFARAMLAIAGVDGDGLSLDDLEVAVVADSHWPFERGELLLLDRVSGREPFGEGRKPAKWDVVLEEFGDDVDAAIARAAALRPRT